MAYEENVQQNMEAQLEENESEEGSIAQENSGQHHENRGDAWITRRRSITDITSFDRFSLYI